MHVDISGKSAIITGAGRGIGLKIAKRFAAEGARVALLELDPNLLERALKELRTVDAHVDAHVCDVGSEAQVRDAVAQIGQRFGAIDILVNNAGIAPVGEIDAMDAAVWDHTFATNTRGVMLCSRAVLPYMKKRRFGRILNASSFAAKIPSYALSAYSASKAAVDTFTRVLAAEVGPWNITANTYLPGMIPTEMNGYAVVSEARQHELFATLSLRRWGSADDIASLLIFLSSDLAGYISGSHIEITGGKFAVQFPSMAYQAEHALDSCPALTTPVPANQRP